MAQLGSAGLRALGTQSKPNHPELIVFDLRKHRIRNCVDEGFFQTDEPVIGIICAGVSRLDLCRLEQQTSYQINVQGTFHLIDDLVDAGAKPVFLSSDGVFDGTLGYYNEQHPCCPLHEYGRQKVQVEEYLQSVAPDNLIIRPGRLVGDDVAESHLLSEWYRLTQQQQQIACIEKQILSPTYVNDLAKGIILACQQGLSGLYHLANPEFFPREELAQQFLWALGSQTEVVCKPEHAFNLLERRATKTYLDSTKFVMATGMHFTSMREVFNLISQNLKRAHQSVAPNDAVI